MLSYARGERKRETFEKADEIFIFAKEILGAYFSNLWGCAVI